MQCVVALHPEAKTLSPMTVSYFSGSRSMKSWARAAWAEAMTRLMGMPASYDLIAHRVVEENGLLGYVANLGTERSQAHIPQVVSSCGCCPRWRRRNVGSGLQGWICRAAGAQPAPPPHPAGPPDLISRNTAVPLLHAIVESRHSRIGSGGGNSFMT